MVQNADAAIEWLFSSASNWMDTGDKDEYDRAAAALADTTGFKVLPQDESEEAG